MNRKSKDQVIDDLDNELRRLYWRDRHIITHLLKQCIMMKVHHDDTGRDKTIKQMAEEIGFDFANSPGVFLDAIHELEKDKEIVGIQNGR